MTPRARPINARSSSISTLPVCILPLPLLWFVHINNCDCSENLNPIPLRRLLSTSAPPPANSLSATFFPAHVQHVQHVLDPGSAPYLYHSHRGGIVSWCDMSDADRERSVQNAWGGPWRKSRKVLPVRVKHRVSKYPLLGKPENLAPLALGPRAPRKKGLRHRHSVTSYRSTGRRTDYSTY